MNIVSLHSEQYSAAAIGVSKKNWETLSVHNCSEIAAKDKMSIKRFDVLPIDSDGYFLEYYRTESLNEYSAVARKKIGYEDVVPATTSIRDVVKALAIDERWFLFLSTDDEITGLVTSSNLNSRLVRVYLFNLLSKLEIALGNFLIDKVDESLVIEQLLNSENEKHKALKKKYTDNCANGFDDPIASYLFLSDIFVAIQKNDMFESLGYCSKNQFKSEYNRIVKLRNSVAHPAKPIISNYRDVKSLWEKILIAERMVFHVNQELTSTEYFNAA